MPERGSIETEVEVCLIGQAEDDMIDGFITLTESQKKILRDFITQLFAVPLSILARYGRRVYSAIRESSFLEFPLGDGLSVILYYLNEVVDGIRQISVWSVDFVLAE